ncbi:MAG: Pimeloyl-ACP methyl ester carboxylesterase [Blastococcus sp.]|jgi:pimeloyl-ACP methyl ester carboxylesterase|nr:Pimeloyl-ACP methyl ester carboxylesterase [Blastococcus sp.]MCW2682899.1 Pimeloyl-ACP methyl ester carboxylesterase [Blastococcus sp.]
MTGVRTDPPPLTLPAPTGPPPPGSRTVTTDDGVPLHVEFDGDPASPLTVVFSHGFTARLAEWELQRAALRDRARLVFWDQRGHGRSGWTKLTSATIDRTGRDLGEVLDATTDGPVMLVGHSMGGMSIMALARQRPDLFGSRVVGVFLLATSAGGLVETGILGRALKLVRRLGLLGVYLRVLQLFAPALERFRRRGTAIGRRAIRRLLFGNRKDADPASVRMVQQLLEETPLPVTMAFYATFLDHDESASLEVLRRVPVTVVAATHDRLTPAAHGRRIAALIGDTAELIVVPGAGHSVNLTRTQIVDDALNALMDRIAATRRLAG